MEWPGFAGFNSACDLIVPCTIAVSPSEWYTAMLTYKTGGSPELVSAVIVALWRWVGHHWSHIVDALGGEPDIVTVVPSTSRAMPTPLFKVVASQPLMRDRLRAVVKYDSGNVPVGWQHRRLAPTAFIVDPVVNGRRVLIIEDTWVSGSTPLSTAMAVRRAGASRIALVAIARMVYETNMSEAYAAAASSPVDFTRWPR